MNFIISCNCGLLFVLFGLSLEEGIQSCYTMRLVEADANQQGKQKPNIQALI